MEYLHWRSQYFCLLDLEMNGGWKNKHLILDSVG